MVKNQLAKKKKESACNAGDLGSTPGLVRFPGGGHESPWAEEPGGLQSTESKRTGH